MDYIPFVGVDDCCGILPQFVRCNIIVQPYILFITILSVLHVKRDVEGCRCKYCGGLDCLKQIAGTPKKTYTWWGGWRKSQEEIGEIIETETRYGQTVSQIRHSVFKNIEQREHYKKPHGVKPIIARSVV